MHFQLLEDTGLSTGYRNTIVSILAGILFASAWWIIIDAAICYGPESLPYSTHAIGSIATVGFILLNLLPQNVLTDDIQNPVIGKLCIFVCLLINFSTFIAASWIMFASYVSGNIKPVWPGVAIFLQNLLIFCAAFVFRFGRNNETHGLF